MLRRIYPFLLLILVFCSCCREKDLPLTPALMAWTPYSGQQELIFLSSSGNKLTFIADLAHFNQQASDKACGEYAIETFQVNLRSVEDPGLKLQVTLSHEILVRIKLLREDVPQGLGIDFNTISEQYISDPWRDRFYQEREINGKVYREVLHAYGLPAGGTIPIFEIFYGKGVGLIGFNLFSGEAYYLQ